jgi:hypothetical protein
MARQPGQPDNSIPPVAASGFASTCRGRSAKVSVTLAELSASDSSSSAAPMLRTMIRRVSSDALPSSTIRPSRITTTRSAALSTSGRMWEMKMLATPPRFALCR